MPSHKPEPTPEPTPTQDAYHIRWMIRRDSPEVLDIEKAVFEFPWTEDDLIRCLRQRNCIGMVAEFNDEIVGYFIYELHKNILHILNFAVKPERQRQDVGTQMIGRLIGKLNRNIHHARRNQILLEVRETNLAAQLFFHSFGFRAMTVLREFYDDTSEDAYLMEYRTNSPAASSSSVNRVARYMR